MRGNWPDVHNMNKTSKPVKQICLHLNPYSIALHWRNPVIAGGMNLLLAGGTRGVSLLLQGIHGHLGAVTQMTGNPGYRSGDEAVDQFAKRNLLLKPMLPESIETCHQKDCAYSGSKFVESKPRLGKNS